MMSGSDDTQSSSNDSFSANPLDVQMQQAWEQVNAGDSAAAADLFRGAIVLADANFRPQSLELAQVMTDASSGLFLLGEPFYAESSQLLAQAIQMQTAAEGELNIGCGRLHRQLAAMHNARNDFEAAAVSLHKAIDIFEALQMLGGDVDPEEKRALYKEIAVVNLKADEARGPEEGESAAQRLNHCSLD